MKSKKVAAGIVVVILVIVSVLYDCCGILTTTDIYDWWQFLQ